tara:strand:+ start:3763 stop:4494 length:732 start_codon:yes stop_codon:yes gene_type:complete
MSHSKAIGRGRLCNQVIRNIALSIVAEKFDLKAEYQSLEKMNELGIPLFSGKKTYSSIQKFSKIDKFDTIKEFNYNLETNGYFQCSENITRVYKYLQTNKEIIINKNPWKERFSNNKDLFIHVRAGDMRNHALDTSYYQHCIEKNKYENIYLATDNRNHKTVKDLINKYPNIELVNKSPVQTIQFGCTCSNIILSHGSFSAIIGYLGYFSKNIYYYNHEPGWSASLCIFHEKGFIPINQEEII